MFKSGLYVIILLLTFTFSSQIFAAKQNCKDLISEKVKLESRIKKLETKQPDITRFYGFSIHMVRGTTTELASHFILQITDSIRNCEKLVDGTVCDETAGEIIQLIKGGFKLCRRAIVAKCGMC